MPKPITDQSATSPSDGESALPSPELWWVLLPYFLSAFRSSQATAALSARRNYAVLVAPRLETISLHTARAQQLEQISLPTLLIRPKSELSLDELLSLLGSVGVEVAQRIQTESLSIGDTSILGREGAEPKAS